MSEFPYVVVKFMDLCFLSLPNRVHWNVTPRPVYITIVILLDGSRLYSASVSTTKLT
jgi:hypothetical protein